MKNVTVRLASNSAEVAMLGQQALHTLKIADLRFFQREDRLQSPADANSHYLHNCADCYVQMPLDATNAESVNSTMKALLVEANGPVVFITHQTEAVAGICARWGIAVATDPRSEPRENFHEERELEPLAA